MAIDKEEFAGRLEKLLSELCKDARERGLECDGPADMTDEEYSYSVLVYPEGAEYSDGVDVGITLLESAVNGNDPGGVNFGLRVVSYGGHVLGGLVPYNYTPDVWVSEADENAVEERWNVFSHAYDPSVILDQIQEWFAGEGAPSPPKQRTVTPAVSATELETIQRHRASLGMAPLDPAAGWTADELSEMARTIRETGRMANPVRMANVGQLKRRLTEIPRRRNAPTSVRMQDLAPGTQILLTTGDRRHPFRAKIVSQAPHSISLESPKVVKTPRGPKRPQYSVVLRRDGSISHLVRYPLSRNAFPRESRILDWDLVT